MKYSIIYGVKCEDPNILDLVPADIAIKASQWIDQYERSKLSLDTPQYLCIAELFDWLNTKPDTRVAIALNILLNVIQDNEVKSADDVTEYNSDGLTTEEWHKRLLKLFE